MSRIYISYNSSDKDFALSLTERLKLYGHNIFIDLVGLPAGADWRQSLSQNLKESEIFVVLISNESAKSAFVVSEIGAARAYASESDRMLIVPVILDEAPIPAVLQDIQVLRSPRGEIDRLADLINQGIAAFIGRRAAKEEKAAEVAKRIEINAAAYVEEAIESQRVQERRNRVFGAWWYMTGFLALVVGIVFAFYGVIRFDTSQKPELSEIFLLALKTFVVIGLLGACAKYAFMLGKSYVNESLKSADRMHAISFGKFYLRAYGEQATWSELKEVFQNWNIDRSSSFSSLDASQFDPKIIESTLELVKTMTGQGARNQKRES